MQSQDKETEGLLPVLMKERKPLQRAKSETAETLTIENSETITQYCECCDLAQACTPTYVTKIRESFSGKWVCGLCAEAVMEQMRRNTSLSRKDALEAHMTVCKKFNSTIRLNPNFYLASAMKDVAKKCSQRRRSIDVCVSSSAGNSC